MRAQISPSQCAEGTLKVRDGADCTKCSLKGTLTTTHQWSRAPPAPPAGTPAGPARSRIAAPAAASSGSSPTKSLKHFWKLSSSNNNFKPPVRTECSPACAGLSPLCKSFSVYNGSFYHPRS